MISLFLLTIFTVFVAAISYCVAVFFVQSSLEKQLDNSYRQLLVKMTQQRDDLIEQILNMGTMKITLKNELKKDIKMVADEQMYLREEMRNLKLSPVKRRKK